MRYSWSSYGLVVECLLSLKILCVMIVPVWVQHEWILRYSSHAWILPRCSGVMSPKSRGPDGMIGNCPWDVIAVLQIFQSDFNSYYNKCAFYIRKMQTISEKNQAFV